MFIICSWAPVWEGLKNTIRCARSHPFRHLRTLLLQVFPLDPKITISLLSKTSLSASGHTIISPCCIQKSSLHPASVSSYYAIFFLLSCQGICRRLSQCMPADRLWSHHSLYWLSWNIHPDILWAATANMSVIVCESDTHWSSKV